MLIHFFYIINKFSCLLPISFQSERLIGPCNERCHIKMKIIKLISYWLLNFRMTFENSQRNIISQEKNIFSITKVIAQIKCKHKCTLQLLKIEECFLSSKHSSHSHGEMVEKNSLMARKELVICIFSWEKSFWYVVSRLIPGIKKDELKSRIPR